MYRNPETADEQYPRTPRENLHHSLRLLAREFPGRTVKASKYEIPVFSWEGAGSERGGEAEYIKYDNILFLPAERDVVAVSIGDRNKEWYKPKVGMVLDDCYGASLIEQEYSALLLQRMPKETADMILEHYVENVAGKDDPENEHQFSYAMHLLSKRGTRRFWKLPLFAYDEYGLFEKSRRFDPDSSRVLKKVDSLGSAESITQAIAQYAQGKAQETPLAHFARHRDDKLELSEIKVILKHLAKA